MKIFDARFRWRFAVAAGTGAIFGGCTPTWLAPLEPNLPLVGPITDTRTGVNLAREELLAQVIASRLVILGEAHDNPVHHRLQAEVLEAMLRAGRTPALALEQFDREHQAAIDNARAGGERDPERIANAGRLDRKGWRWLEYKPLVELALKFDLPLLAANFSREEARRQMRSGSPAQGVPPAGLALRAGLEQDIVAGHCGIRPGDAVLNGMIEAQRARDARMAEVLAGADEKGAVLVAGSGHARRDRGAPSYLSSTVRENVLSVGLVEVSPDGDLRPAAYAGIYDVVWFTPRAVREDPCLDLKLPGAK